VHEVKGFHGEWNMGSPGGWEYQRVAQLLGKMAWQLVEQNVDVGVRVDFDHPIINAVPGFARMLLRAHQRRHGKNPVHAVLLAEEETLDVVLENKRFVEYLNTLDGVRASLAGPGQLSLKKSAVYCEDREATVIFMDFNADTLIKIGRHGDVRPVREAIRQGILVNPRGMEPLGVKGLFEVITGRFGDTLSDETVARTPWTRRLYPRSTTGPDGAAIADLVAWIRQHWNDLVLKPAYGYSGHGIYVGFQEPDPDRCIADALTSGDYIVQELIPLKLWSETSTWCSADEKRLFPREWQTDFRCFITDEGLQGFLARFGGVPTNVGSGGGIQPIAVLTSQIDSRKAVEGINESLLRLGYDAFMQIQEDINRKAVEMGFTYLLGPIMITFRPRVLTTTHIAELQAYARNLWHDAVLLEELWRKGELDDVVTVGEEEKAVALAQPWQGGPALMVSDGLFSFGADLLDQE
jgi:hypothetical protein